MQGPYDRSIKSHIHTQHTIYKCGLAWMLGSRSFYFKGVLWVSSDDGQW